MKHRQSNQIFTEFRYPMTASGPLARRKYTLTHSDETGDLFVTIAAQYAEDKITPMRDEVRLEWTYLGAHPILFGEVAIDGKGISGDAQIRNTIFKREMPIALQSIRYGDRTFFETNPHLDQTPILIYFNSSNPNYNKLYSFGTIGDYSNPNSRKAKIKSSHH